MTRVVDTSHETIYLTLRGIPEEETARCREEHLDNKYVHRILEKLLQKILEKDTAKKISISELYNWIVGALHQKHRRRVISIFRDFAEDNDIIKCFKYYPKPDDCADIDITRALRSDLSPRSSPIISPEFGGHTYYPSALLCILQSLPLRFHAGEINCLVRGVHNSSYQRIDVGWKKFGQYSIIFWFQGIFCSSHPNFREIEKSGLHCVLIIGWTTHAVAGPLFLIHNSWGPEWANRGFAYIAIDAVEPLYFATGAKLVQPKDQNPEKLNGVPIEFKMHEAVKHLFT
ncbi:hypothetical protein CASFOL_038443 [Castilleja foliolosa]|uniref:Peptidase C1A papain C-terminal domain-containing protein n=1 Tax=Castilleja foliolosa TaxID=1961234 RepID=A0ABD3BN10_9LAMI